jgi:outer membrane immunogenic protein
LRRCGGCHLSKPLVPNKNLGPEAKSTADGGFGGDNWQGSVRGRVGAAFDRVLVYGTGGPAFASYDLDYTFPGPVFGIGDQFEDTVLGFTVGGGAAFAAFSAWGIFADYRFTDYETASGDITICCAPPPNGQDHDLTTHAVRLGVSRRFGAIIP